MTIAIVENDTGATTTRTASVTLGTGINFIFVMFTVNTPGLLHPTNVQFDGVVVPGFRSADRNNNNSSIWGLNNPSINGTYNLTWDNTTNQNCYWWVLSFSVGKALILFNTDSESHAGNDFLNLITNGHPRGGNLFGYHGAKTGGGNFGGVDASYNQGGDKAAYEISSTSPELASWGDASDDEIACVSASMYEALGGSQILIAQISRWPGFLRDLKRGLVSPEILRKQYGDLLTI